MTTPDAEALPAAVAAKVRSERARLDLTLDQLVRRSGVSKGALVALEAGVGNPNLSTLVRLADAFGVPVSELLEETAPRRIRLTQRDQAKVLWRGDHGGWAALITVISTSAPVELWWWVLQPGEEYLSHAHPRGVTETITVISGGLTLVIGDETRDLPTHATVVFAADLPHVYRCAQDEPCELLMTVHLPAAGVSPAD
ncbi:MAG: helix-turn-helix domain-containing protein [Pseudonocardiaceae bacterium]